MEKLVLLVAVVAYIKFLRSDYVKQFGEGQRFVVYLVGCAISGVGLAVVGLAQNTLVGICLELVIVFAATALVLPWINQPTKDKEAARCKQMTERLNHALQRTDEPFASKRNAICARALSNSFESDEQFARDLKILGIMFEDDELAKLYMDKLLEESLIYKEEEPVKPVHKNGVYPK